jgi:6,7-dimethyl-8-ribityllumazine synthase
MNQLSNETTFSIAIVVSLFNEEITSLLLEGALERLKELGVKEKNITVVKVPGAIEIPLTAKLLAKSKKYQALICLGAVIRGETSHYDYVCAQVSEGCQQVMMAYELPVIFGVLTTENEEQAKARVGGSQGHKGREAAEAALHMVATLEAL